MADAKEFQIGDDVMKLKGDYTFVGTIVAKFNKLRGYSLSGPTRYVVQNPDGVLHIFAPEQLEPRP